MLRRRGKLPFVPQDAGPTGLSAEPLGPIFSSATSTPAKGGESTTSSALRNQEEKKALGDQNSQRSKAQDALDENAAVLEKAKSSESKRISNMADTIDPDLQFFVMDYAAGMAFRNGVLPSWSSKMASEKALADLTIEMGRFFRGESFLTREKIAPSDPKGNAIARSRIENVEAGDATILSSWFFNDVGESGGENCLPHTNILWSEKWEQRCVNGSKNPDHEVIKLVVDQPMEGTNSKEGVPFPLILSVAYIERHSADPTAECKSIGDPFSSEESARATVIREVRLHPSCNPVVAARLKHSKEAFSTTALGYEGEYKSLPFSHKEILSSLIIHILNRSLLYGTSGITILCPKQEFLEKFYCTELGDPAARDENGRFIFRMHGKHRLEKIIKGFERHMSLLNDSKRENDASSNDGAGAASKRPADEEASSTANANKRCKQEED